MSGFAGWLRDAVRDNSVEADTRLLYKVSMVQASIIVILVLIIVAINASGATSGESSWLTFGVLIAVIGMKLAVCAVIFATRRFGSRAVSVWGLALCILIIFGDYATLGTVDVWILVVPVGDLMLSWGAEPWATNFMVCLAIFYLAMRSLQETVDFGFWSPISGLTGRYQAHVCPIKDRGLGISTMAFRVLMFSLDYHITRGFAIAIQSQLSVVAATVRVSERVVEMVAAYATDDARRVVAEEEHALPEGLRDSYEQLLDNLDSYRAFLPDSLLFHARRRQQQQQQRWKDDHLDNSPLAPSGGLMCVQRSAPGLGDEVADVGICFTDIESSTVLWEAHPQGMYDALNIHNDVMRTCYTACDGYEVKTIGDSFMVAFDTVADGTQFGLEAQRGLLRPKWPEDLLLHPLCEPQGPASEPLWGGLRVRIGFHFGPARVQQNPVTGRCDYFGQTVNTAARLEHVLRRGGMLAVSPSVHEALHDDALGQLGSPVVYDAGPRVLKGIQDEVQVWVLVPRELQGRLAILDEPFTVARETTDATHSTGGSDTSPHSGRSRSNRMSIRSLGASARRASAARLNLKPATGSVCCVRASLSEMPCVASHYGAFASSVALAADRMHGVIETLLSAVVSVTWNVSVPCTDHTGACRRFLTSKFSSPCHLGLTSGAMLRGPVFAGRRSFTVVIGNCVGLATALAEEAERCGDLALAAGVIADTCAADGEAFCAQLWQPVRGAELVVWEVHPAENDDGWQFVHETELEAQQGTDWVEEATALLRKCVTVTDSTPKGERDALLAELERVEGPLAPAAERLALRVVRGTVRIRPMVTQWNAGGTDSED